MLTDLNGYFHKVLQQKNKEEMYANLALAS